MILKSIDVWQGGKRMYISPIGVGISDNSAGYGSPSYGMSVYRRNAAQKPQENSPIRNDMPFGRYDNGNKSSVYDNGKLSEEADRKRRFDSYECQTCKNRKYQDGSDDAGVSFKTPTKVDPKAAASAVRSHEQEHVSRNRSKAEREGKEIVSQTVTIHTGICPECGRVYVSGGTTRTTTRDVSEAEKYSVGLSDPSMDKGKFLNAAA